jgi:aspartyl-tRNA(Asn)/glutamyl-tRNA(Gln) amidotransferase subunit A
VARDEAIRAARDAEGEIRNGHYRGPLHGVPVAIKDNILTAGIRTEAGSGVLRGFVPSLDATVASRLKEAGAVIVGKTTTQEFAYTGDAPPTRNPWDLGRTPGGSSAGSAAAVAAQSCMAAIGTETMGSLRMPSAVNGVVGLKPTYGRISRSGVIPLSWSMDHCGPIAKTVEDAALMLNAVAGFDPKDGTSARVAVPDYRGALREDLNGVRLGIPRNYFFRGLHQTVRNAVEQALRVLEQLGAVLVTVTVPDVIELSRTIAMTLIVPEASAVQRGSLRERAADYYDATRTQLEAGELVLATHYLRALQARQLVKNAFRDVFMEDNLDALVTPMEPSTATKVDESYEAKMVFEDIGEEPWQIAFSRLSVPSTLAGLPGLTVPCGFSVASEEGRVGANLPIGLQIIGRPFAESTIFHIGFAYQSSTDWHRRRPLL